MVDEIILKGEVEEAETGVVPYETDLKKSNLLIGAKYKASLTELRITYASLYSIQTGKYREEPDGLVVEFNGSDLKKLLNVKGNGIYEALEPIANTMATRSMGWSDPESHEFEYISLITKASYKNSIFTVKFNNEMKNLIVNLQTDFTTLNRITMMNFSSTYSFRLYELLKKQCYYPRNYKGKRDNVFKVNIGLSELKFEMGVANADLDVVKKILTAGGTTPDYDKALEKSPEKIKSYNVWTNFKARCLDKAIGEINGETDIFIKYEPQRKGKGGKVYAIEFTVFLDGAEKANTEELAIPVSMDKQGNISVQLSDNEKFPIWAETMSIFATSKIQFTDAQAICDIANYDMNVIKRAKSMLDLQKGKIENVTGWVISCIRDNYEATEKKAFSNFDERENKWDDLEKRLISGEGE